MRLILNIVGGIAIVAIFFFGTLFVMDRFGDQDPLAREAKSLRAALSQYRAAKGAYPAIIDRAVGDIKKELAGGGYLRPDGRPEPDKDARYHSPDGKNYGLLFHIDRSAANPSGSPCVVEVDTTGPTGWWGRPAKCKF